MLPNNRRSADSWAGRPVFVLFAPLVPVTPIAPADPHHQESPDD